MKCESYQNSSCRSCELLDKSYGETILLKEKKLKSLFLGNDHLIKPSVIHEKDTNGSRTKAKFAAFSVDGEIYFGFYNKDGVAQKLESCPLHADGINDLLSPLKEILKKFKIIPYDIKEKKGELKYILISKSTSDNPEILLRFVLRSKESLDRLRIACDDLTSLPFNVKVVTVNIQPIHQAILEGEEELVLTNKKVITHQFDEFQLTLGARSFFQVTPSMAKKLYNSLSELVRENQNKSLLDLYCGVGAFSFYASRFASAVTGVEISSEAIDCAKISLELNMSTINFYSMDVDDFLKKDLSGFDSVVVNPPRRGLNASIISNLKKINPEYIYYSSCNAETMEQDYDSLKEEYAIVSLQIFDMFPYTNHFETLMCLKRK